jgi:hypothetical protein
LADEAGEFDVVELFIVPDVSKGKARPTKCASEKLSHGPSGSSPAVSGAAEEGLINFDDAFDLGRLQGGLRHYRSFGSSRISASV